MHDSTVRLTAWIFSSSYFLSLLLLLLLPYRHSLSLILGFSGSPFILWAGLGGRSFAAKDTILVSEREREFHYIHVQRSRQKRRKEKRKKKNSPIAPVSVMLLVNCYKLIEPCASQLDVTGDGESDESATLMLPSCHRARRLPPASLLIGSLRQLLH